MSPVSGLLSLLLLPVLLVGQKAGTHERILKVDGKDRQYLVHIPRGYQKKQKKLIPLRHFAIPGHVSWTVEGERFSWHMKLNDRDGEVLFYVTDPDGGFRATVDPKAVLVWWQVNRLDGRPRMIQQLARHLAEKLGRKEGVELEVRVRATVSLNNRPPQLLIDPDVDLVRAATPFFGHASWILPLEEWVATPR
jgi:hypothetical protein